MNTHDPLVDTLTYMGFKVNVHKNFCHVTKQGQFLAKLTREDKHSDWKFRGELTTTSELVARIRHLDAVRIYVNAIHNIGGIY